MKVILDTNLLLLFVVGSTSTDYIEIHRRLRKYSTETFKLLIELLRPASAVLVTPNTLTETSNLLDFVADPARTRIYERFRNVILGAEELYLESRRAVNRDEFVRLGLTDVVLIDCVDDDGVAVLLTDDFPLYRAAAGRGLEVINFTHERERRSI